MAQDDAFKKRLAFIDKRQQALIRSASELEQRILQAVMKQLVQLMKVNEGRIVKGNQNLKLSQAVDIIFNKFQDSDLREVARQMADDFSELITLNKEYYTSFAPKRYEKIVAEVRDFMRERIGLSKKGEIIKDGYLDKFIRDPALRIAVKNATVKAVIGGSPIGEFTDTVERMIVGSPDVDGGMTKYFKGFAYDSYAQFDRASNTTFATKLNLKAFIYAGGLIENSRDFCIHRNDKVFTVEEADEWKDDPELPRSKDEQENGVTNYLPLIDMGRWNCRHTIRFISKQMALRSRPDLKDYFSA